jgi:hypothetical protein
MIYKFARDSFQLKLDGQSGPLRTRERFRRRTALDRRRGGCHDHESVVAYVAARKQTSVGSRKLLRRNAGHQLIADADLGYDVARS